MVTAVAPDVAILAAMLLVLEPVEWRKRRVEPLSKVIDGNVHVVVVAVVA